MKPEEKPPSRDELLAMAYVDGELAEEDRLEFEKRLANEPTLAREVTDLRGLGLIARQVAPPEPQDYEWRRLEAGLLHTGGSGIGFLLLAVGSLGIALWVVVEMLTADDMQLIPKLLLSTLLLGGTILFLVVLRARLRLLPYDPYTKVQR